MPSEAASVAATYSASVELVVTSFCLLDDQEMGVPLSKNVYPVVDRRVWLQSAKSESTYPQSASELGSRNTFVFVLVNALRGARNTIPFVFVDSR